MWATCWSTREYTASRPWRSTPTRRAPRSTRRCCETSGWLIPSRSTSSCTNRGWPASSVTMASRAGAASTFSSSPAASNAFVCADTTSYKHMPIRLCKHRGNVAARSRPSPAGPVYAAHSTATCIETQSETRFWRMNVTNPGGRARRLTGARQGTVLVGALAALALAAAGCGSNGGTTDAANGTTVINAIGAENEYANVLSQIGGRYVHVSSILNNPNTDPHTFEASPQVAQEVSGAQLIVQNGVGYDTFMNKIESASPDPKRKVIIVQNLLGLPDDTPNPHLWYSPKTMPAAARAMAADLSALLPAHKAFFQANLVKFDKSLTPWLNAIAAFKARYPNTPVATTEPVADYMLQAAGTDNLTPFTFQADIMNGVDPSPEDIALENGFFTQHKVKVFCYNQQVVDSLTTSIRQTALKAGVPVVGVYETMPTPGYDYQSWMLAEVNALQKAVADKISTEKL